MKNQADEITKISSFKLAAYLMAHDHILVEIEPSNNPKRKVFVLQGKNTPQLVSEFYNDIKVKRFLEAERELKERLYNSV